MAAGRVLITCALVLAACAPAGNPDPTSPPDATEPVGTATTAAVEVDDGLDVFRDGMISAERQAVDELYPSAPRYEMDLVLGDDLSTIDGTMTVTYTNEESTPLTEVVFRLFPNIADGQSNVSDVAVDGAATTPILGLEDSVLRVPLSEELAPGERVVIEMTISVVVPSEEGGNYGTFLVDQDILAAAHFYPILAVYDDEGWNVEIPSPSGDVVYSDVGFYRVDIEAPDSMTIVTSGRLTQKSAPDDAGIGSRTFVAGPVRDFYLAASNRFEIVQATVGETTINSYAPAEFTEASRAVLDHAAAAVRLYNELYGMYPYVELDLVSTTTTALGVEYPGAIALAMYHYERGEGFEEPTMISTVVHEVAHQWFYGTVGNDQLDEPWLDEAMAQWATQEYWADIGGDEAGAGFESYLESRWQRVEGADIPIGMPVAAYEGAEYGAIIYGRGPLFIGDLADAMGREAFDRFLIDYAETYQYGIATTQGYQALAEASCDCDLSVEFDAAVYPPT